MVPFSPVRRVRNVKRRVYRPKADFFWLSLDFQPPECPTKVSWLQSKVIPLPPFSIIEFKQILNRLVKDGRTKGLILEIQTELPFATTRTIIDHLKDFREQGKELITFATKHSLLTYWLASIGSKVTIQNQGHLWINGIYASRTFFADFLKKHGLQVEKMAVSPYKSALDGFTQSDISPEDKENREALFESIFDTIVQDISSNRGLQENLVRESIDVAPLTPKQAVERGLIDQIISPEQLSRTLGSKNKLAKLLPYEKVANATLIPAGPSKKKLVAIIPVEGMIVDGKSREAPSGLPIPIEQKQAGDHTIVPMIRRALINRRVAAGVLYVNSRGGSAFASESMRLALEEFATKKPLVAYFSNVAASGGYYVGTAAQYIVAQPQSITGSIGVIMGKFNYQGFLEKNQMKTVEFTFGKRSDWLVPTKPLGEEEREVLTDNMLYFYDHFLEIVANSRNLDKEHLKNDLAGGRVWTGAQALKINFIDELGNLQTAIEKAREFARLKPNSGVVIMQPSKKPIVPIGITSADLNEYIEFFQTLSQIHIWAIEPNIHLSNLLLN